MVVAETEPMTRSRRKGGVEENEQQARNKKKSETDRHKKRSDAESLALFYE
jgi:hypothetical protein